jgi:gamma-glutamyltranspeptidase / glutathione hydrolase
VPLPKSPSYFVVGCLLLVAIASRAHGEPGVATGGMVATVHPLATDAAVDAMKHGGNAVDAAVAAALTLGVVNGYNSGIGGGCFILIRRADGRFAAIDGRETAPLRATREMYIRDGKPQPELSTVGPLASGTPGALAAYAVAVKSYGRLRLSDLLLSAADLADRGFTITPAYASAITRTESVLSRFPGSKAVLLKPDGTPPAAGEMLKQPDLAATYRAIAKDGIGWFYRGPFAEKVDRWMGENGGILAAEDFARYRAVAREPIKTDYRGYTIVGFPPPSSGGVHVGQILNILERFNLKELYGDDPARFYHVIAEAMKLAFADRAFWLGDPDFARVPRGLIDRQYAAELAEKIDLKRAGPVLINGRPPRSTFDLFGKHTTHIATADAEGNWVAITATVNTTFGSKVIVPGTGVVLNNEMDDFAIAPGVPNAFGLVGAEANAVAPGKRPLSSMSPTIVLKDGRPVFTLGAAGGPKIITAVVMTIVYRIDLGMELPRAVASPRIHHQWMPEELKVQSSLAPGTITALESFGHPVTSSRSLGILQAIGVGADGSGFIGVHDPKVAGKTAGP